MDIHHRPTELALSQSFFWSEVSLSSILIKYRYKTSSQFQARYHDIQGSYHESSHDWPTLLFDDSQEKPGQHNSLAFPMASSTWLLFNELSSPFYSGIRLGCLPWESPLEHYSDSGMIPKSITHTWSLSLSCSDISFLFGTSVLVDLFCLVLHARLCHSHELQYCVERHRPNMPLQESFPQRIAVNQCHFFALSQVQACQGPHYHYFSH